MTHRCEPGSLTPNPQPGPRADAADVSEEAFPGGVKRGAMQLRVSADDGVPPPSRGAQKRPLGCCYSVSRSRGWERGGGFLGSVVAACLQAEARGMPTLVSALKLQLKECCWVCPQCGWLGRGPSTDGQGGTP